ncbi:MAG: D-alanine--D-alanine ligase, partial [Clostridia bacterium]|nr:D-alanine--D-alanine ligase [Clostridia bacterium]
MKENILVIFGGKSAEHDISIITGLQTISNVDRDKFNVIPLYISKNNNFYIGEKLCYLSTFMPFNSK